MIKFILYSCNKCDFNRIIAYEFAQSNHYFIYYHIKHVFFYSCNFKYYMKIFSSFTHKKPPLIRGGSIFSIYVLSLLLPQFRLFSYTPILLFSPLAYFYFHRPTSYLVRSLQAINSSATT